MQPDTVLHKFGNKRSFLKVLIFVLGISLLGGVGTGYVLASTGDKGGVATTVVGVVDKPKSAQQDNRTFRDFAEGTVQKKKLAADDYSEGTHELIRQNAVPVALTSSVVDLSIYEGKKVKVYGETQKAIKEGWLMDVGRVEEIN